MGGSAFMSVPRQFFQDQAEKEGKRIPKPGTYRPRYDAVEKSITGKVAYGKPEMWAGIAQKQVDRIRTGQFEEKRKLCPAILKALDQQ